MLKKIKSFANKDSVKNVATAAALFGLVAGAAQAGVAADQSDAFYSIYETIELWLTGALGRTIALGLILIGIAGGMARQSLMAFAVGIGGGLGMFYAPSIIEGVMGATLPAVEMATTHAVDVLSNKVGLL